VRALRARWEEQRNLVRKIRELKAQREEVQNESEQAQRQGDLARAAELRFGKLPEIEKQLTAVQEQLKRSQGQGTFLREEVTEEDIAAVVSRWTGIPVSKMLEAESDRLLHMEDRLKERVVGQDEAVTRVARAIRLARSGLKDPTARSGPSCFSARPASARRS